MGKMWLQVDSFPFLFLDQFIMACHGCIHDNSRDETVLGTDMPERKHATVPDLLCVFTNFRKLQNFSCTYKIYSSFWWLTFSFMLYNAITNRGSCTSQLHWCSQPVSQQTFPGWTTPLPNIPVYILSLQSVMSREISWLLQGGEESTDKGLGNQDPLFRRKLKKKLHKHNYYWLNLLLLFRIPFYTHVQIKMGFYRCIYRDSVV